MKWAEGMERDFIGVILCGGEGKRLRPLTYYFQKTMIPIGRRQKPLLEYIVKLLRYHGIRDIVMLVGYKSEQIINYFEDGSRFDLNITYEKDPAGLKGSGHAILNAYNKGLFKGYDNLLIYYGDILSDINLRELMDKHLRHEADSVLAVASRYQLPVGVVEAEGDRVLKMVEKPWINIYATIGILTLSINALDRVSGLYGRYKELDIMTHIIPELVESDGKVLVYRHDGYWYDVGSTEKYEKIDNDKIEEIFNRIM